MMFFELRYKKYLCCTFGQAAWRIKMQLPERTERSGSYVRYQLMVACVVNLVRVNLFFTQYCRNICFRNICLDVFRHNQLMPWQRINKLTPEKSTKNER